MTIILIIIAVMFFLMIVYLVSEYRLNKPVNEWSDQDLVRRLAYYDKIYNLSVGSASYTSSNYSIVTKEKEKCDAIRNEMYKRQIADEFIGIQKFKQDYIFNGLIKNIISEKEIQLADAGDIDYQTIVGLAYLSGANGLQPSPRKAYLYLSKVAITDDPFACLILSEFYEHGIQVERNTDLSVFWFNKAKENGSSDKIITKKIIDRLALRMNPNN
jgi:TPR repeat protein